MSHHIQDNRTPIDPPFMDIYTALQVAEHPNPPIEDAKRALRLLASTLADLENVTLDELKARSKPYPYTGI